MTQTSLPHPPLQLAHRVGSLEGWDDPFARYDELGRGARDAIVDVLPDGWSWEGKRVLDFGCGAGRTLRHFAAEAEVAEFWGSDIDAESIAWLDQNLSPPFRVFTNDVAPPLDQPDGHFDLIWCVSVFTHLTDLWSEWLLELRRILKPGGLFVCTFMGEGMSELIAGEPWDEDLVGMNVLRNGQSWDLGGPMVLHLPWWIREHWGRAFDVLDLRPSGFGVRAGDGQGVALLRKNEAQVTRDELERIDPANPREAIALRHNLDLVQAEVADLRIAVDHFRGQAERSEQRVRELERNTDDLRRQVESVQRSRSWQLTQPLRRTANRMRGRRDGS